MGLVCQMILQQGGDAADFFCIRVRGPAVGGRCCCHDSACSARFGLVWLIPGSTRTPRCQVGHARQLRTVPVVRDGKSEPELVTLELERMGPHGFFGEACTVQQSKKVKQPNSVQAITNVTLTVLPAADFRDVLRMYPTVRSSIKAFLHRRCVVVPCAVCVVSYSVIAVSLPGIRATKRWQPRSLAFKRGRRACASVAQRVLPCLHACVSCSFCWAAPQVQGWCHTTNI